MITKLITIFEMTKRVRKFLDCILFVSVSVHCMRKRGNLFGFKTSFCMPLGIVGY